MILSHYILKQSFQLNDNKADKNSYQLSRKGVSNLLPTWVKIAQSTLPQIDIPFIDFITRPVLKLISEIQL